MAQLLQSLFVVLVVAGLAPVVSALLPGRMPQVVLFVVGGILVGPSVLGWADPADLRLLSTVGLGLLFLLAGYELPPMLIGQHPGRLAIIGWFVSLVLAFAIVGVLAGVGFVHAFVPVSLALTTTALGTLLPILQDNKMLGGVFGSYLFAAGAVGELGPVLAISLFLGINDSWLSALLIATVAGAAYLLSLMPRAVGHTRIAQVIQKGQDSTTQSTLRWTLVLLVALLLLTEDFGLDAVLGAFLAGMALRHTRGMDEQQHETLLRKLDAVGYGFFIPIFFICSGMGLDVDSIAQDPMRLVVFFVLLLVVRGAPALLVYRNVLSMRRRVEMMFLTATALPLLVALTEIGLGNGTMLPQNAAALVGAGALSVAVFPMVAVAIHRRGDAGSEDAEPGAGETEGSHPRVGPGRMETGTNT